MVGRLVKAGRSTMVTETWFGERGQERPLALAQATFAPSPNPADVLEVNGDELSTRPGLRGPLADLLGIRLLGPGVAELERSDYVTQNSGTIQGGAVALLAEVAAGSVLGRRVAGLDVRYLSAVRIGPARAAAETIGGGLARVEVSDRGNEDRLACVVVART
jgi:acyl-coenzyme A thioesterase PaaI-like protein